MSLTVIGLALAMVGSTGAHTPKTYKSHPNSATHTNSISRSRPASAAPIPKAPRADSNQELNHLQMEQNRIAHSNVSKANKPVPLVPPTHQASSSERIPPMNFHKHTPKAGSHPVGYADRHPNFRMQ